MSSSASRRTRTSRKLNLQVTSLASLDDRPPPDLEEAAGEKEVRQPARCCRMAYLQLFLVVVTGLHCFSYFLKHTLQAAPVAVDLWVLGTGPAMAALLILEIVIGVVAQGGPPWRLHSWVRFLLPLFRKLEILFLIFALYRLGRSVVLHLLSRSLTMDAAEQANMERMQQYSDELTVATIVLYRAMRIWGVFYGVSTKSTEEFRRQLGETTKLWMKEHTIQRQEHEARRIVRLEKFIDSLFFQAFMLFITCMPVAFYYASRKGILRNFYTASRPMGYVCSGLVFLDFSVHCLAQGGERFFLPKLQRCEGAILGFSLIMMIYATWNYRAIEEDRASFVPPAQAIVFGLIAHRCLHIIGLHYGVSGSQWSSKSILDSQTHRIFTNMFGDLFEVPPSNVKIGVSGGFTFQMSKARLRHEAFEGFHLPLAVRGGLLEDFKVSMPPPDGNRDERKEATTLTVHNLLLVLGPGDGLAEACALGGSKESDYWDYEHVLEAKSRLVELIARRLRPPTKQEREAKTRQSTHARHSRHDSSVGKGQSVPRPGRRDKMRMRLQNQALSLAQETSLRQVVVEITSVTIQFEDPLGKLGLGALTLGASLGKVYVHRFKDKFVKADILRTGVFLDVDSQRKDSISEFSTKELADQQGKVRLPKGLHLGSDRRRAGLGDLLRQDPQLAVTELHRIMNLERFRGWSQDLIDKSLPYGTDQRRHSLAERWQEQRWMFRFMQLKIRSGPDQDEPQPCSTNKVARLDTVAHRASQQADLASKDRSLLVHFALWVYYFCRMSLKGKDEKAETDEPESTEEWTWQVKLRPVQINLDDHQARALITLQTCLRTWLLLDAAMCWHPESCSQRPEIAEVDKDLARHARSTTYRLWWHYAVRRVLARRRKALQMPWQELALKAHTTLVYQALLLDIARRGKKPCEGADWEKRWLQEMQTRLFVGDIVHSRRHALAQAAEEDEEAKPHRTSFVAANAEAVSVVKRFTLTDRDERAADEFHRRVSGMEHFLERQSIGSADEDDAEEEEEEEEGVQEKGTASATSSQSSLSSSKGMQQRLLDAIAGTWMLRVPRVDVHIMRGGPLPRPVVLHLGISGVSLRSLFLPSPDADAKRRDAGFADCDVEDMREASFTLTVDGFRASCPDATLLLGGFGKHICTVTRLVQPPPPRPGHLAFSPEPVALAFRAALPSAARGLPGLVELHTPDLRVVAHRPLLSWLLSLRSPDGVTADPFARDAGPEVLQASQAKEQKLEQPKLPKHHLEHSEAHETRAEERAALRTVHLMQKAFELLTGVSEETRGLCNTWSMDLSVGEVRALQVSEYWQRSSLLADENWQRRGPHTLLLEQCSMMPFRSEGARGGLRIRRQPSGRSRTTTGLAKLAEHSFELHGAAPRPPGGDPHQHGESYPQATCGSEPFLSPGQQVEVLSSDLMGMFPSASEIQGPWILEAPDGAPAGCLFKNEKLKGWCGWGRGITKTLDQVAQPLGAEGMEDRDDEVFIPRTVVPADFVQLASGSSSRAAAKKVEPTEGGDGAEEAPEQGRDVVLNVEVQMKVVYSDKDAQAGHRQSTRPRQSGKKIRSL